MIVEHLNISLRIINFQTKIHHFTRKHTYIYNEIKKNINSLSLGGLDKLISEMKLSITQQRFDIAPYTEQRRHYNDVIMRTMASQIICLMIVYSTV